MRTKGSGALFRTPADVTKPLLYWTGVVEKPPVDGKRQRLTVRSKDYGTALRKLEVARRQVRGMTRRPPEKPLPELEPLPASGSTGEWILYWFDAIAKLELKPKTATNYGSIIRKHLVPAIGDIELTQLSPADVRRLHANLAAKGLAPATVLSAHRILSSILTQAMREGYVRRNVAQLTATPRKPRTQLQIITTYDARRIMRLSADDRLGSRWAAAFLSGARQGELLGLELDRIGTTLDLSWQLQRLSWSHGCGSRCGWQRGADCPSRVLESPLDFECRHLTGGLWLTRPKSAAGWREIPLVGHLREVIEKRMAEQESEPNPYGLLWTRPTGTPIDPRADNRDWHRLLSRVGVPQARLHSARHTTVDMLYEAGVPEIVARDLVGHSTIEMTRRYRHVTVGDLHEDAIRRLGDALGE